MNKYQVEFIKVAQEHEILDYSLRVFKQLQVRKLNKLNRYIVDCIAASFETCSIKYSDLDFLLTSSFHGELTTSCLILDDIVSGKTPSPTLFSQSTHNVCAGTLSSMLKITAPSSTICAGEKSFNIGIENLFRFLNINRYSNGLFVYHEQRSPKEFENIGVEQPTSAFIMLVKKVPESKNGWFTTFSSGNDADINFNEIHQKIIEKKSFHIGRLGFEYDWT